jgi:hypothetical protein
MAGTRSRDWPRCPEIRKDGTPCGNAVATLGKKRPARVCPWHFVQAFPVVRDRLLEDDVTGALAVLATLLPPLDH